MSECPFNAPCRRYMGMLADRDELQKEVERLRAEGRQLWREVERLRFALGSSVSWADKMKEQDAEAERLRAALIAIGEDPETGLKIYAYVRTALGERG